MRPVVDDVGRPLIGAGLEKVDSHALATAPDVAGVDPEHVASRRVLERAGFTTGDERGAGELVYELVL